MLSSLYNKLTQEGREVFQRYRKLGCKRRSRMDRRGNPNLYGKTVKEISVQWYRNPSRMGQEGLLHETVGSSFWSPIINAEKRLLIQLASFKLNV